MHNVTEPPPIRSGHSYSSQELDSVELARWIIIWIAITSLVIMLFTYRYFRHKNNQMEFQNGVYRRQHHHKIRHKSCKYRRCLTSEEREEINVESVKRKPIPPQQFLTWLRRRDAVKDLNLEVKVSRKTSLMALFARLLFFLLLLLFFLIYFFLLCPRFVSMWISILAGKHRPGYLFVAEKIPVVSPQPCGFGVRSCCTTP
ncbi:uncharacterized protein LOC128251064 [Octopus bimaculoides]|uniref:uncharacterized protein LOC128251064 n=1 Tax=Octopus bimaculoides TaxID=37653 RepID=UPI0022E70CB8|nr:uncharacterized protein LOC128251064 [Octopus bimaculoides]